MPGGSRVSRKKFGFLFGSIYTSIHFERVGYSIRTNTDAHAGRDLEPTLKALFGFSMLTTLAGIVFYKLGRRTPGQGNVTLAAKGITGWRAFWPSGSASL
jgi:hypothetical protein